MVCASIQPLFLRWDKPVICSNVVFYSGLCPVFNLTTSVAAQFHPVQNSTIFITRTNGPHVKLVRPKLLSCLPPCSLHAFVGSWRQVAFRLHFLGHEGYITLLRNVGNISVEAVSRAWNFPPIPLPAQTRRLATRVSIYNISSSPFCFLAHFVVHLHKCAVDKAAVHSIHYDDKIHFGDGKSDESRSGHIIGFRVLRPCRSVRWHRRLGRTCSIHLEAVGILSK